MSDAPTTDPRVDLATKRTKLASFRTEALASGIYSRRFERSGARYQRDVPLAVRDEGNAIEH